MVGCCPCEGGVAGCFFHPWAVARSQEPPSFWRYTLPFLSAYTLLGRFVGRGAGRFVTAWAVSAFRDRFSGRR